MAQPKEANLAEYPQAFRGKKSDTALIGYSTLPCISKSMKTPRWFSRPSSALSHICALRSQAHLSSPAWLWPSRRRRLA
jgi:hypothetical protein